MSLPSYGLRIFSEKPRKCQVGWFSYNPLILSYQKRYNFLCILLAQSCSFTFKVIQWPMGEVFQWSRFHPAHLVQ